MATPRRAPAFVVVGAQKCGTTSLHRYLGQHPALFMTERKEPHFFSCPGDGSPPPWTDLELYRQLIASPSSYTQLFDGAGGRMPGESSTMYLPDPAVPGRLVAASPEVKAIILVRDPGTRALSAWRMWRRASLEPLDFRDALDAEPARAAAGNGPGRAYVENGRYAPQIERWRATLGTDRVLVLRSDELSSATEATLRRIFSFLQVDESIAASINFARQGVGDTVPRSYGLAAFVRHSRSASLARSALPTSIRHRVGNVIKSVNGAPSLRQEIDHNLLDRVRSGVADDTRRLASQEGWDLRHWLPS